MIDHRFRPWALSLLSLALSLSHVCAQTNRISGVLTQDATWSGDNLLQGTVVVPGGRVVTIEPGSRLLMDGGGAGVWTDVPGRVDVPGEGGMQQMSDAEGPLDRRFYRVSVRP